MASIVKPKGKSKYVSFYFDENGRRRKKTGATDKAVTQRIARGLENRVALRREGIINSRDDACQRHEARPLGDHIEDWQADLIAKGDTPKHAALFADRARRLVAVMLGANPDEVDAQNKPRRERDEARERLSRRLAGGRLSDLAPSRVQVALASFRAAGRSLQTLNDYRSAIRGFSRWCWKDGRLRDDPLVGVTGYNVKEDRALCYRLAVASGLRYAEIKSITPESFDFGPRPSVTVAAGYTKNGEPATLPLPEDLAADLSAFVSASPPRSTVFLLPDKAPAMLRRDLKAAGLPYRDEVGRVFDFHALRCQCATLADAAGVSPRVVQTLMRHSTLELTGRYTRPRMHDIEGATAALPSLRPTETLPVSLAATGTDGATPEDPSATRSATDEEDDAPNVLSGMVVASSGDRFPKPQVTGSNPVGRTDDSSRQETTNPVSDKHLRRAGSSKSGTEPCQHPSVSDPIRPQNATRSRPDDPALQAVIEAWPDLP